MIIKFEVNDEVRKGVGNILLTTSYLLFIFLVVTQVTTEAIQLNTFQIIIYSLLDFLLFILGCMSLNSIRKTERDKVRYISGEASQHITVRLEGERSHTEPITASPTKPHRQKKRPTKDK